MIAQRNWFPPPLPEPSLQMLLLTEPEGAVADFFLLNKLLPPTNFAESLLPNPYLPQPRWCGDC